MIRNILYIAFSIAFIISIPSISKCQLDVQIDVSRNGGYVLFGSPFSDIVTSSADTIYSAYSMPRKAAFITNFDSTGKILWSKNFFSLNPDGWGQPRINIEIDSKGDFVVAMIFYDTIQISEGIKTYPLGDGIGLVIVKYNFEGAYIWHRLIEIDYSSTPSLETDNMNNIYLSGLFTGDLRLDNHQYRNSTSLRSDIYIIKLKEDGKTEWVNKIDANGGNSSDLSGYVKDLRADINNDVYILGSMGRDDSFSSSYTFGNITRTVHHEYILGFYGKFDSHGNPYFFEKLNRYGNAYPASIDALGEIATITTNFNGPMLVDTDSFKTDGVDALIIRIDSTGSKNSVRQIGNDSTNGSFVYGSGINKKGELMLFGSNREESNFSPLPLLKEKRQYLAIIDQNDSGMCQQYLEEPYRGWVDHGEIATNGEISTLLEISDEGGYSGYLYISLYDSTCSLIRRDSLTYYYPLSIKEFESESRIEIYPNPTSGLININSELAFPEFIVTIRDISGRLIKHENFRNVQKIQTELKGQDGMYFVEVWSEGKLLGRDKVIKQ